MFHPNLILLPSLRKENEKLWRGVYHCFFRNRTEEDEDVFISEQYKEQNTWNIDKIAEVTIELLKNK